MKAIVHTKFGPPEVLQLKEVEKPIPQDNEVLIRIHASSVVKEDPDTRAAPGINGLRKPKHTILGQELSGEIEAIGSKVTRFKPGDTVFGFTWYGTNAEYISLPENAALVLKPSNMNHTEAASVPNGALTALPFLRDLGEIQAGQQVLINGASGSVGSAAVQLAKYYGAEVTAVCSGSNLDLARSLGADNVVDYTNEDFTQNGKTYDIIFDTVGKRNFSECKGSLKSDGVFLTTVPTLQILLNMIPLPFQNRKKVGFMPTGLRRKNKKVHDLKVIKEIIEAGGMKAVIDRCYPLEETAEAHRYVAKGHKKGNVVITVESDQ